MFLKIGNGSELTPSESIYPSCNLLLDSKKRHGVAAENMAGFKGSSLDAIEFVPLFLGHFY